MPTRSSSWTQLALVALVAIPCWGCPRTSGDPTDAGGGGACTNTSVCATAPTPPAAPEAGATRQPCDIYADDGGPCVAAHSTVRALYATYSGPLYQVKKADGTTADVHPLAPGGLASSGEQETFCGADACTISIIYDQSEWGNHLTKSPAGMAKTTPGNEANAKSVPIMLGAQKVYGIHIVPGVGYRNNQACGTATCDDAETEYMVVAGSFFNGGCCFDYGNMER